ncbi:MAG: DUF5996 family protein [Alphaproteobacteria bacterium]|nr:DUF5996 family protein [Alphaproteobacteria bacterium]
MTALTNTATKIAMPDFEFPPLPLAEWQDSKTTLHLFCQIVGKIRMGLHPKLNHWWHVPLYVSTRGLTTGAIPYDGSSLSIEFDLIDHALVIATSTGTVVRIPLVGQSVAGFYQTTMSTLKMLGIEPPIYPYPYDHESKTRFDQDKAHSTYDEAYTHTYWRILVQLDSIFKAFSARFQGKQTPVHLFWHSFDLALTRFSGRAAPREGGTKVDREAYSHEVISFGFWPGDARVAAPAFYSYTYPEPAGLTEEPLAPAAASWVTQNGGAMALLMYDELLNAEAPSELVLDFLESAYQAGAKRADWPIDALAHRA